MMKTKLLFLDTETTGLPKSWKAPLSHLDNWPRMVQLAWILFDEDGQELAAADHIVKPRGYTIPYQVARIHGITQERAEAEGEDLGAVLGEFIETLNSSQVLVAHNISFDEKIVGAELLRLHLPNLLEKKKKICTMMESAGFCKIPNRYGYKWPTLAELHRHLFHKDFEHAHNAAVDISITAKCFWELRRLGAI